MGEKDITERHLEDYNDVFADILNVLMFGGERRVLEDELEPLALTSEFRMETQEGGRRGVREQERDIGKLWTKRKTAISVIGLDNQTDQDETMPLRVMAYDGASYKSELLRIEQCRETNRARAEAGKETACENDTRYPVITLVLYYGDKPWRCARTLYESVEVDESLRPFVNDFRINLIEVAFLDKATVEQFRSDFRFIAEYFVQKRRNEGYHPSSRRIRHVDETLKMMAAVTGNRMFEDRNFYERMKRGENMVDYIEETMQKREEAGKQIGMEEGREHSIDRLTEFFVNEYPELTREQAAAKARGVLQ